MKVKFYQNSSRIYDFLNFPDLINYTAWYEERKNDDMYKEVDISEYIRFIDGIYEKLNPYKKELENFYAGAFTEGYSFISLTVNNEDIMKYDDEEAFLDFLLNLNETEINERIVLSLLKLYEEETTSKEKNIARMKEICKEKSSILDYIKGLTLEANIKWSLYLAISDPVKNMKDYVELMKKIKPLFNEVYEQYESEINEYGNYIKNAIIDRGEEGIREITYNILDKEILGAKEISILVSLVFSYALQLDANKDRAIIAWGLRMGDAFKQIKEISDDKLNKRVQIFKNLGDRTRYEVLKYIAAGETSTKVIAEALNVSSATVSYHISNFLTSKVIKVDMSSKKHGYNVDYNLLEQVIKEFKEDLKFPE